MKTVIAAVGRLRRSPLEDVFADYVRRLRWEVSLHEVDASRAPSPEARREQEADKLRRHLPAGGAVVVLDERGEDLASDALAQRIARWQEQARVPISWIIGGPDGVAPSLVGSADLVLSFGRATWPHLMVRVMLAEQLYRAATILDGHPYHRGS